jgi:hypothetical protein
MNFKGDGMVVGILKWGMEIREAEKISHFLFGRKN